MEDIDLSEQRIGSHRDARAHLAGRGLDDAAIERVISPHPPKDDTDDVTPGVDIEHGHYVEERRMCVPDGEGTFGKGVKWRLTYIDSKGRREPGPWSACESLQVDPKPHKPQN